MTNSKGSYRGKPLEDHSKEELIDVVMDVHRMLQEQHSQASRDRSMLLGMIGQQRGVPNWKAAWLVFGGLALTFAAVALGLRLFFHVS